MIDLPPVSGPITAQEYRIWEMTARGWHRKEIEAELRICRQTVDKCRGALYRKLGVSGATAAVLAALQAVRHGVVSLPPRSSFVVSQPRETNLTQRGHFTNSATARRNTAIARSGQAGRIIDTTAKTPAVPTSR